MSHTEVELRYKINNADIVLKTLATLGVKKVSQHRTIDHWFIPNHLTNHEDHEQWYNVDLGTAIRIRETSTSDKTFLTLGAKTLLRPGDHSEIAEAETNVEDLESMRRILTMLGLKDFLTIDKERVVFSHNDLEVTVDTLKDYGVGLEIEYDGDEDTETALEKIKTLATDLGLSAEDQHERSITVSAMHTLAKF